MAFKIKKDDSVKILSGKDRGKTGNVLKVLPSEGKVVVEGVNIVKRHRRPRKQGEKGQIVRTPSPLSVSKVQLLCPSCSKPNRVKIVSKEGVRHRICRKCGSKI